MVNLSNTSSKLYIANKIHNATTEGAEWKVKDLGGRFAKTACGTVSHKVRPHYVPDSHEITCEKCRAN
jgi:hypothetical protein